MEVSPTFFFFSPIPKHKPAEKSLFLITTCEPVGLFVKLGVLSLLVCYFDFHHHLCAFTPPPGLGPLGVGWCFLGPLFSLVIVACL